MGRFASSAIAKFDNFDSLTIADLNKEAARKFAASFGNEKIFGIGIDVTNKVLLKKVLSQNDVVLNLTGPFFKFAYPILKSALEEDCHYLDICDDWEPTEKMFTLNGLAKEKGKLALLGLGASPGITNLLALKAMNELDAVSKVYTGWDMSSATPEDESSQIGTNAAMVHGIEQMIGQVKIFKDKKFKMARPLEKVTFEYPQVGEFRANIFGHPEAITFPHHYPEISESLNLMHGDNKLFNIVIKVMRFLIEIKLLSKNAAARILGWLETLENNSEDVANDLPPVYGYAKGVKDGKETLVGVTLDGDDEYEDMSMGEATGYPLAVGLKMLVEGKLTNTGVFAPEACGIDPDEFFKELSNIFGESAQMQTIVTKKVLA